MSYILDALKKSQQERQQSANPTIQSLHQPIQTTSSSRWPIVAVSLCFFALLISGFLLFQWIQNDKPIDAEALSNPKISRAKVDRARSAERPVKTAETVATSPEVSKAEPSKSVVANTVLELWQLPDPIQSEIPAMTFSFHVYSNKQERRTIIINGRRLKEGGQVEENLQLLEITEAGVVLSWKNKHQFYVPVVESW